MLCLTVLTRTRCLRHLVEEAYNFVLTDDITFCSPQKTSSVWTGSKRDVSANQTKVLELTTNQMSVLLPGQPVVTWILDLKTRKPMVQTICRKEQRKLVLPNFSASSPVVVGVLSRDHVTSPPYHRTCICFNISPVLLQSLRLTSPLSSSPCCFLSSLIVVRAFLLSPDEYSTKKPWQICQNLVLDVSFLVVERVKERIK